MTSHVFVDLHDGIDIIGLIGLVLFLIAAYRLGIKKWSGKPVWYELDIAGSVVCLTIYSYSKGAFLGIITILVWGLLAFMGLISYRDRRRKQKRRRK